MKVVESRSGRFRQWLPPEHDAEYVVGVDASEGRDEEADHTAISVWKRSPTHLEQVAEWFGHLRQGEAGELIGGIGMHYNEALINVERNISGAIEYALRKMPYPEERLFSPPVMHSIDKNPVRSYFTVTTRFNKKTLLDLMGMYMEGRGKTLVIRCWELLNELSTLQRDNANNISMHGKDRSMSAVMAVYADCNNPLQFKELKAPPGQAPDPPFGVNQEKWRKRRESAAMEGEADSPYGLPEYEQSWW